MKITLPITALVAILGLAFVGVPVHAETAAAPAPAAAKTAAAKTKFSGTLSAVDAAGGSISITDKTVAPRTFAITPATKIKKDGKAATLADFKVGDKVGGSFTTDATGKLTATTLSTGSTKTKKDKKAAATTAAPAAPAAQ